MSSYNLNAHKFNQSPITAMKDYKQLRKELLALVPAIPKQHIQRIIDQYDYISESGVKAYIRHNATDYDSRLSVSAQRYGGHWGDSRSSVAGKVDSILSAWKGVRI